MPAPPWIAEASPDAAKKKRRTSHLEERLAIWIAREQLPPPMREFRFAPPRLWRFDFAWVEFGIAIEVEGGTFMAGRHNRGAGMAKDAEKYNEAALLGWRVFRVTGDMFRHGEAFEMTRRALTTAIRYVPIVLTEERT
jgi:very-short-patch-repair endonuclease